jgi:hypothetical protein
MSGDTGCDPHEPHPWSEVATAPYSRWGAGTTLWDTAGLGSQFAGDGVCAMV